MPKLIKLLNFKKRLFSNLPRTNSTKYNSQISFFCSSDTGVRTKNNYSCVFDVLSELLYGSDKFVNQIEDKVFKWVKENKEMSMSILGYTYHLGYDIVLGSEDARDEFDFSGMDDKSKGVPLISREKLYNAYIQSHLELGKSFIGSLMGREEPIRRQNDINMIIYAKGKDSSTLKSYGSIIELFAISEIEQVPIEVKL